MRLRLCRDLLCGRSGKEILTGALALAQTLEDGQTKLLDPPLWSSIEKKNCHTHSF